MIVHGQGAQLPWAVVVSAVLGSLVGSGFFSGTETGLMSVSRIRLHLRLRRDGNRRLETLAQLVQRPEDPVLTCLVGTNLFNVLGSAVLTTALALRYGHPGELAAAVVMSALTITFAEILPKLLWREYPEQLTLLSVPPLRIAMMLLAPVRWSLLGLSGLLTRRLQGREPGDAARQRTAALLRAHPDAPTDRLYRELLDRCLELGQLDLRTLMTPLRDAVFLPVGATLEACRRTAAVSGFSRLPVTDGGAIVGWVLVRDLLLERKLPPEAPLPPRLLRDCLLVDQAMSPWALFEELRWQRQQLAIVVDAAGNPCGLVTLEDLLEVLVGRIEDEFDRSHGAAPRVVIQGVRR